MKTRHPAVSVWALVLVTVVCQPRLLPGQESVPLTLLGDAGLGTPFLVGGPFLGQKQFGIQEGFVAALADTEMDGNDAVGDLADATEVLPLDAWGLGARLEGGGFIDEANGAEVVVGQGGQEVSAMALQLAADLCELPEVVTQELLQGADGTTRGQGDGLGGLAFEVGEEPFTVGVQWT